MESVISTVVKELENRGDSVTLLLRQGDGDKKWVTTFKYIEIYARGGWINKIVYCYKLMKQLNVVRPNLIIGLDPWAVSASRFYRHRRKTEVRIGSWIHFTLSSYKAKVRDLLQYADFHLAISLGIANELKELVQIEKNTVHVVFNPTEEVMGFIQRPAMPTFLLMGRLTFDGQKRVNDFLYSLSELRGEWQAIIVGDGPDAERLKKLAIELHINDNINWTGWVSNPWNVIEAASTLVLTSQYEGFPMVLIEALNRGVPCLSSDCPTGPRDIITHGENGWLYPLNGITQLTALLQQIIDDPEILPNPKLVKKSAQQFTTKVVIDKMRNVFLKEENLL
jgi:UDP-D-galactose:(glucosyl)LPS alpha-1,6-D-galactosyltransferase